MGSAGVIPQISQPLQLTPNRKTDATTIHVEEVSAEDKHEIPKIPKNIPSVAKNGNKRRNGEKGYYRNEELGGPIHTERHMRIIVCGAGASGLCLAYKLKRSFENFSLQLFEKNDDISGTWYENRYPG